MNHPQAAASRRSFLSRSLAAGGLAAVSLPGTACAVDATPPGGALNVRDFGARGDGAALDTAALQQAIEACAAHGGGTVCFPPGRYLSGTLRLKSRVRLWLESGATLLGSPRLADYPATVPSLASYTDTYTARSLLYAEQAEQIGIAGQGVIDGQGAAFQGPYQVRPYLLRVIGCRDVAVRDVTLKDSPMWVQHYLACDGVRLDGLTVTSKCNANNDGIDIDACQRVRISNCDIRSGDDALVLKSTLDRPCRHVVVTNCVLSSDCNAFKLGTESNGGFENILLSNCALYDTRLAGIALELVDGGTLDGVSISHVTMQDVRGPIFIRLGDRARPFKPGMARPGLGRLRNVRISDVQALGAGPIACSITGLPAQPVENISLSHVRIRFAGGAKAADPRRQVPEKPEAYPEYSMFGVLPAFGFYCRHARNLSFHEVEVETAAPDPRPSLACEEVDELRLVAWRPPPRAAATPPILLRNVRQAAIQGCRAPETPGAYLRVSGKTSAGIRLFANDLAAAARSVDLDADVPPQAVAVAGQAEGR